MRWLPAISIYAVISWLSHQPSWPTFALGWPDHLLHTGAYLGLGLAVWVGMGGQRRQTLPWRHAVAALVITAVAGALDEVHQSFVPGRSASVADWVADTAGAVLGVGLGQLVAFAGLRGLWENRNT